MSIEPLEAQRGACVSAGAEGEPWIEPDDDGIRRADALVMRTHPQTPAEAHGMKVLQPLTLPGTICQRLRLDLRRVDPECRCQCRRNGCRRGHFGRLCVREQALHPRRRPERRLPGSGFKHRGPHEIRRLVGR